MTAIALHEDAAQHLRNALQILTQPDDDIDELDLAAIRERLRSAVADIEENGIPDQVARSIIGALEQERLELIEELRLARQQLSDGRIHITVDWAAHRYDVQRELASFDNWPECVAFVRQLRGAVTGEPADDQPQPVRALSGARG
jgi:hypothetical protein